MYSSDGRRSSFSGKLSIAIAVVVAGIVLASWSPAGAEFPYPACAGCPDPSDYEAYLFNPSVDPPALPNEVGPYDFRVSSLVDPSLPATPEELFGIAGMSVDEAWKTTTGRPDVLVAILDSGIVYSADTANKAALNAGELPLPQGSLGYDANGDGVFNVADYAGDPRVVDDGNGILDPRDLILSFSDATDADGNGYVDDICGWDVHERDNDPFDDVDYGHGTGEAKGVAGEVNNGGSFGLAPNAMFVPVKVSDSFVADANEFAAGIAYAVDRGVTIASEALGALNNTPFAQAAVEYAFAKGVLVVASAADEQSYHHNYPAQYERVFWANSIRPEDGTLVTTPTNLLLNGCTNFGGKAQVAIASTACSSEATERASGMFALLYSAAMNEVDRGNISVHPITGRALSPNEAIQLLQMTADDIDFSSDLSLDFDPQLALLLPQLTSERFPTHAGHDKYTGYGRANAAEAVARVAAGTIPPEAEIVSPVWHDVVDPVATPLLDVVGTAAAHRDGNNFEYTVEWACGVDPLEADFALPGHELITTNMAGAYLQDDLLAQLDTTNVTVECLFGGLALPRIDEDDFDESYAITLRLRVEDTLGNAAEARKNVFIHEDPSLRPGFPLALGTSGESSPVLFDLDDDGDDEIVMATADGQVHAIRDDGTELPGWPVSTALLPLPSSATAYQPGALGALWNTSVLAPVAVGDLDGDGWAEVVVADMDGRVYAFDSVGSPLSGFPVSIDPTYSDPAIRDVANRVDDIILGAPTLADLDTDGSLEIIVAAGDRHLYVWRADGTPQAGFPVLVVDRERMQSVDPVTHKVVWKTSSGSPVGSRGTKLVGSPSVGDIDGDGDLEIVVGSNEEYVRDEEANFFIGGLLFLSLADSLDLPNGRLYAISHLGKDDPDLQANPSGPYPDGWPVRIGLLIADLLPTVGHGVTGSAVLADVDDDGADEILIAGNNGPALLIEGDGTSHFGTAGGKFLPFHAQTFVSSSPQGDTVDFGLTFGVVGTGAAGDVDGDTVLDFTLPSTGGIQLLDNQGPALQGPGDQQLVAWSTATRDVLPAFPRRVEDLQFLSAPAIADIDGDAIAELLAGSGGYYLHAFSGTGGEPSGWPKFTGGWTIGSLAVGDLDGDDLVDVVATTREGRLYAWEQSGTLSSNGQGRLQWPTFAHDRQRTGNVNSGVPLGGEPAGCERLFRGVIARTSVKYGEAAADDKLKVKIRANLGGLALDPTAVTVDLTWGTPDTIAYAAAIPPGSFQANSKNTKFNFVDPTLTVAPGIKKVVLKLKKGAWEMQVQAAGVDAELPGDLARAFVQIGDVCIERARRCALKPNGKTLVCR
jgi:hypothetical protein